MEKKRRITIKDVAQKAQVSLGTASNVLNEKPVSSKNYDKVQQAIKELNYRRNSIASLLRTNEEKLFLICFFVDDIYGPSYTPLLEGAEKSALEQDFHIFFTSFKPENKQILDRFINESFFDGMVFFQNTLSLPSIAEIAIEGCPIVSICYEKETIVNTHILEIDDKKGVVEAVNYFVDKGHSQVCFVGGVKDCALTQRRFNLFSCALKKRGISISQQMIFGGYTIEDGGALVEEIIKNAQMGYTLFFCYNDEISIGISHELKRQQSPFIDKIVLCGFDNIPLAEYMNMPSISQDLKMVGKTAVDNLIKMIEKKEINGHSLLPTTFIPRR